MPAIRRQARIVVAHQELEQLKQELKELVEEQQRLLNQKSREFELDMEDLFRRPTWKYPNGDIEI